jgi:hypothetical protein
MYYDIDSNINHLSSEEMSLLFVLKHKKRRGETVEHSWDIPPYDILQNRGMGRSFVFEYKVTNLTQML